MRLDIVRRVRFYVTGEVQTTTDTSLLLLGRMASWQARSIMRIGSLNDIEFKVFSQFGEDGIIDWIVEKAQIPSHLHTFVEFGVESYSESNTRFLLQNRNWSGCVLDGDPSNIELLRKRDAKLFWHHNLVALSAFISRENINDLLTSAGICGEIGLLSIDIDGNDYWVWEAITAVRPIICACEYNAVFGDVWPLAIPYKEDFVRNRREYHNLYFGASIIALQCLAKSKGYQFLGTTSEGVNAFFIREDYAHHFDGLIATPVSHPSSIRESKDQSGKLSYATGIDKLRLIQDLPVINTQNGKEQALTELNPIYSDEWLKILMFAQTTR
jgi:hypothetical protein